MSRVQNDSDHVTVLLARIWGPPLWTSWSELVKTAGMHLHNAGLLAGDKLPGIPQQQRLQHIAKKGRKEQLLIPGSQLG